MRRHSALPPPAARAIPPPPEIPAVELGVVVLTAIAILVPGLWGYTLIDPWETHYGEVARRMIEDSDWVFLHWQDQVFQSKPVLTFWLIGGGLEVFGVGEGGGYSGEMVASPLVILAVRLPFALFGVFGLVITWYALARLAGRRVAWLSLLVMGTVPFYFFIARQAITDMPMGACLVGAISCFALATDDSGEQPLRPLLGRLCAHHLFLVAFAVVVGVQALYYGVYFYQNPQLAYGIRIPAPHLILTVPMLAAVVGVALWVLKIQRVTTRRQVLMLWFYLLIGVSVLAKGPPALGIAGMTCFFYLALTGRWRLLRSVEIPRGVLVTVAVALPWHIAMFMKAGPAFYNEYVQYHLLSRATAGENVHGATGTFNYFMDQLGVGMWPWSALLPAAAAALFVVRRPGSAGHARFIVGIWAIGAVALFSLVDTKFHHYILPAVPALAILVAFFIDDLLAGRVRRVALVSLSAVAISLLIARDMIGEQKQLIELFIYRYNRPWPEGPPWYLDVGDTLHRFALAFAVLFAVLALPRLRRSACWALVAVALVWGYWAMNGYMGVAAPHWGQRELHRTYYQERAIHGVDIKYANLGQLADDWGPKAGDLMVRSVLPEGFEVGQDATVTAIVPGHGLPDGRVELEGEVSRVGDDRFWIRVPDEARAPIRELVRRGRNQPARGEPWVQVDADRLIAWQLNWRGENFWSSGEIWGATDETQTVFKQLDNKAFLDYLDEHGVPGRTYFLITEAGRADRVQGVLPTDRAKETVRVLDDTSCNKFTLLEFTL